MATKKIKWFLKDGTLVHPETEWSMIIDAPEYPDDIKNYTSGTGVSISSSNVISTVAASASVSGHVTTGAQTFAGRKTFNGGINIPSGITLQVNGSSGTSGQVLTSNGGSTNPTWQSIFASATLILSLSSLTTGNKTVGGSMSTYKEIVFIASTNAGEDYALSIPYSVFSKSTSRKYKINGADYENRWFIFKYVNTTQINIDNIGGFNSLLVYGVK